MITAELIQRRLEKFWGYGSLSAPVWFVGMEEGLGDTQTDELQQRFEATDGKQTVDIRDDMRSIPGHMKFYTTPDPPGQAVELQRTYMYPIALNLYLHGNTKPTTSDIRHYQLHSLGDVHNGRSAAIELSPLPAKNVETENWIYGDYGVPGLSTRVEFETIYLPKRCAELCTLVATYSPRLVIFYSRKFMDYWEAVASETLAKITPQMHYGRSGKTAFCAIPHGNSFGMSYDRVYEFPGKISNDVGVV